MKYIRRLGVAFLTFALGVALSPIHFYLEQTGVGKGYSLISYTSSYYVKLWYESQTYASPVKADEAFNQRLGEAVKIFEVGPEVNENGTVGRRALALFFLPEIPGYYTEVFRTDGRRVLNVSSTSALHVVEFEKQQR